VKTRAFLSFPEIRSIFPSLGLDMSVPRKDKCLPVH